MPAQEEKCPHCGGIIEENDYPSGIIVPHCDKHAAYMQQEEVSGKCPNAPDSPMSDGDWDDGGWDFDNRTIGGGIAIVGAILIPLGAVIADGGKGDLTVGPIMAIAGFIFVFIGAAVYNVE